MLRTLIVGIAAVAALLPAETYAQEQGELTLYNRGQFKGARYRVTGPTQGIRPAFEVRSVTVPAGTHWELCSGNTFTGCRRISQSSPSLVMTVRSARPVAAGVPAPERSDRAAVRRAGQSLRGMASEFFTAPEASGSRVPVAAATAEAASASADAFCRSRGWRSSAYAATQTIAGSAYLADVLCVLTER